MNSLLLSRRLLSYSLVTVTQSTISKQQYHLHPAPLNWNHTSHFMDEGVT